MEIYKNLRELDVSEHVEKKQDLNYLSWSWAYDELMKKYPEAQYEVERFDGKPYLYDDKTGYMVFTKVKIEDMEKEMWLPVMDSNNKAMLDHSYTYDTKFKKDIKVEPATMFDINKAIMRCLVKNLAMFGLGINIYAGEDLPEVELTEEDILKMAKEYKFGGTKHPSKTIEEVYKMGDKNFLQWCLDSGKDENVKKYITLLTDLKPKDIPATEGEQLLKLQLMGELKELVDKLGKNWEDIHNYYHHTDLQEYTYAEMKGLKEMLCKSKK